VAPLHAQAYIPAQPAEAKQKTRFSHTHEDPGRPESSFPPPRQGAQTGFRKARFSRVAFLVPPFFIDETRNAPLRHEVMANAALKAQPDFEMPAKKKAGFPRTSRLLRHADFERVYREGRRHFSACMTVFYCPSLEQDIGKNSEKVASRVLRVGFTVSRALGGAVQRNRMKRRLREAVRLALPATGIAADVVINPKKSLLTADFSAILNEVSRAFAKIEQERARGCESAPPGRAGGRPPATGG
jgi:ribonuclease P protein component